MENNGSHLDGCDQRFKNNVSEAGCCLHYVLLFYKSCSQLFVRNFAAVFHAFGSNEKWIGFHRLLYRGISIKRLLPRFLGVHPPSKLAWSCLRRAWRIPLNVCDFSTPWPYLSHSLKLYRSSLYLIALFLHVKSCRNSIPLIILEVGAWYICFDPVALIPLM